MTSMSCLQNCHCAASYCRTDMLVVSRQQQDTGDAGAATEGAVRALLSAQAQASSAVTAQVCCMTWSAPWLLS